MNVNSDVVSAALGVAKFVRAVKNKIPVLVVMLALFHFTIGNEIHGYNKL